jgi:hypothetical protein
MVKSREAIRTPDDREADGRRGIMPVRGGIRTAASAFDRGSATAFTASRQVFHQADVGGDCLGTGFPGEPAKGRSGLHADRKSRPSALYPLKIKLRPLSLAATRGEC